MPDYLLKSITAIHILQQYIFKIISLILKQNMKPGQLIPIILKDTHVLKSP